MANCKGECNKQLQGLAARLAHAEDKITNHFMGVSTLVAGLAANPLTIGSVTALLPTYNSLPSGMELLQLLKDALPDIDAITMKQLMLSASEAAMDTLAATMDQVGAAMVASASAAVSAAEDVVTSTADALAAAIHRKSVQQRIRRSTELLPRFLKSVGDYRHSERPKSQAL